MATWVSKVYRSKHSKYVLSTIRVEADSRVDALAKIDAMRVTHSHSQEGGIHGPGRSMS